MSNKASQKMGIEMPAVAPIMLSRSMDFPRRTAAKIPVLIPTKVAINMLKNVSSNVAGKR